MFFLKPASVFKKKSKTRIQFVLELKDNVQLYFAKASQSRLLITNTFYIHIFSLPLQKIATPGEFASLLAHHVRFALSVHLN